MAVWDFDFQDEFRHAADRMFNGYWYYGERRRQKNVFIRILV